MVRMLREASPAIRGHPLLIRVQSGFLLKHEIASGGNPFDLVLRKSL